jgi:hypothetical protein
MVPHIPPEPPFKSQPAFLIQAGFNPVEAPCGNVPEKEFPAVITGNRRRSPRLNRKTGLLIHYPGIDNPALILGDKIPLKPDMGLSVFMLDNLPILRPFFDNNSWVHDCLLVLLKQIVYFNLRKYGV